jgi:hypothetical protein
MDKKYVAYIHDEYYLAIKKNKTSFVGKWVEMEVFMLSKISQTEIHT